MEPDRYVSRLMKKARDEKASDIHVIAGMPPAFRIHGEIILADAPPLTPEQATQMTLSLLTEQQRAELQREWELSVSVTDAQFGRFRVTVYYHAGHPEMALRMCSTQIPSREELGLPDIIDELARTTSGLVLVTGPTGMGKTTTLNYMLDLINSERRCKIVTIEDPIEFLHRSKTALVVQEEVGTDVHSFSRALVHVLRQDPDVICVGEMRNLETISTALTAAETGHLVIATLHTPNALQTVERIVDVFPANQQNQVITQLANSIQAVIAQLLLTRADRRGRVLATEVLTASTAVRTVIRENDLPKLQSIIQTGRKWGMHTMDESLRRLYESAQITYDAAISHARDPKMITGEYNPPAQQ